MLTIKQRAAGMLVTTAAITGAILLAGCTSHSNITTENNQARAGINLILNNQPVPVFATSELRKNLAEVEAIQALGSATTTFFFPPGVSASSGVAPVKVCPSQGEPIHATDSLSNPHQTVSGNPGAVIDQMDPNGIYPGSSAGTYVLCLTANGVQKMSYWEGDVETESGAAVWDTSTHQILDQGPSQLPVCTLTTAQGGDGTGLSAGTRYFHCVKA